MRYPVVIHAVNDQITTSEFYKVVQQQGGLNYSYLRLVVI